MRYNSELIYSNDIIWVWIVTPAVSWGSNMISRCCFQLEKPTQAVMRMWKLVAALNKYTVFWKLLGNLRTQMKTKMFTIERSLPHPKFSEDLWSLYSVDLIFICSRILYAALCSQVTTIFPQFSKLFQTMFLYYDLCDRKSSKRVTINLLKGN